MSPVVERNIKGAQEAAPVATSAAVSREDGAEATEKAQPVSSANTPPDKTTPAPIQTARPDLCDMQKLQAATDEAIQRITARERKRQGAKMPAAQRPGSQPDEDLLHDVMTQLASLNERNLALQAQCERSETDRYAALHRCEKLEIQMHGMMARNVALEKRHARIVEYNEALNRAVLRINAKNLDLHEYAVAASEVHRLRTEWLDGSWEDLHQGGEEETFPDLEEATQLDDAEWEYEDDNEDADDAYEEEKDEVDTSTHHDEDQGDATANTTTTQDAKSAEVEPK